VTGAARQWEDWIAEQTAALLRRETAPLEAWQNEGGSQPQRQLSWRTIYPLSDCRWCGSAVHCMDLVWSGLRREGARLCCMRCHQRAYPEDRPRPVPATQVVNVV